MSFSFLFCLPTFQVLGAGDIVRKLANGCFLSNRLLFLISLGALLALRYSSRGVSGAEATAIHNTEQVNEHVDNAFKMEQPEASINVNQVV